MSSHIRFRRLFRQCLVLEERYTNMLCVLQSRSLQASEEQAQAYERIKQDWDAELESLLQETNRLWKLEQMAHRE
jgi:hypothetical protein